MSRQDGGHRVRAGQLRRRDSRRLLADDPLRQGLRPRPGHPSERNSHRRRPLQRHGQCGRGDDVVVMMMMMMVVVVVVVVVVAMVVVV